MKIHVDVAERGQQPRSLELEVTELTIGRVKGNGLVLPRSNVSKRHARVVGKDGALVLVDLKSTNGTYVNGRRLTSPHILKPADRVYIGDFTLTLAPASAGEPTAAGRTPLPGAPPPPPSNPPPRTPPPRTPPPRTPLPRTPPPRTPPPRTPPPRASPPGPPPLPAVPEDEDGAEFFVPVEDAVDADVGSLPRSEPGHGLEPPDRATVVTRAVQRALALARAQAVAGGEAASALREVLVEDAGAAPRGTVLAVVVVLGADPPG